MSSPQEADPLVVYLEWTVLGKSTPGGFVVYEVTIKVKYSGLLGIIRVKKGDVGLVGFVGSRGIKGLSREIRKAVNDHKFKWRPDKYFET